jgi:hypothetical protein
MTKDHFFLMLAAISAGAGLIIALLIRPLRATLQD